jgi:hypothetical protein
MDKFMYEVWEVTKNGKKISLQLPMGCEAGDAYAAVHELLQGVVDEITKLTDKMKPQIAPETPVEVVSEPSANA